LIEIGIPLSYHRMLMSSYPAYKNGQSPEIGPLTKYKASSFRK
jgi:hypothetical protein